MSPRLIEQNEMIDTFDNIYLTSLHDHLFRPRIDGGGLKIDCDLYLFLNRIHDVISEKVIFVATIDEIMTFKRRFLIISHCQPLSRSLEVICFYEKYVDKTGVYDFRANNSMISSLISKGVDIKEQPITKELFLKCITSIKSF